jgi:pimeloyl-ACP methyl ester carboxylesterase
MSHCARSRHIALLGAAVCLAAPASASAQAIPGTNGAPVPALEWTGCPASVAPARYQCSVAEVPLSYRDPHGQSLELALGKLPAADQERKLGTLFWNPGGPGGSGRIPPLFSQQLHERFDFVGFDPRGIAASTPLQCFTSNEQAERLFGVQWPITLAQEQTFVERVVRGTALCGRNGGPILAHMSTANVARDLDLLRQAVGDPGLTYLGFSYGTAIGTYYANLFPEKVRALTLDAVIDPVEWTTGRTPEEAEQPVEYRAGSFHGAAQALTSFLSECSRDTRCVFREPEVDLRAKFDRMLARLKRSPVEIVFQNAIRVVTYQDAVGTTLRYLYRWSAAPLLADFLQRTYVATSQASRQRPQATTLGTHSFVPARQGVPADEPYAGYEWTQAVECTDSLNPSNPWLWVRYARRADRESGSPFGSPWVFGALGCATWPVTDPDRYLGPWDRSTANPLLLIGNRRGDPATPYEDAVSTSKLLANARLLTLDVYGHAAYGNGRSRCIDDAVHRYLIDQELPPEQTVCPPNRGAFDPVS